MPSPAIAALSLLRTEGFTLAGPVGTVPPLPPARHGEGKYEGGSRLVFAPPDRPAGADGWLLLDLLLDSDVFVTFQVRLEDGQGQAGWVQQFSPLCHCETRLAWPVAAADLDAARAVVVAVLRKTAAAAALTVRRAEWRAEPPPRLEAPLLPRGPLMDAFGQTRHLPRPGHLGNEADLLAHLRGRHRESGEQRWPACFSRWGGWSERRVQATGFFRTHHDARRWWLVDPDGCLFWSIGADCVHPTVDHECRLVTRWMDLRSAVEALPAAQGPLGSCWRNNPYHGFADREWNPAQANFIRAFGAERWHEAWRSVAFGDLRRWGFNTAAAWSDESAACAERFPYVRILDIHFKFPRTAAVCGTFPDVFAPALEEDASDLAEHLWPSVHDSAMVGYFLTNEPSWAWGCPEREGPAAVMLEQSRPCASRAALAEHLRGQYGSEANLAQAWGVPATFAQVAAGPWTWPLGPAARADLAAFSTVMLRRLIDTVSAACRRVDPFHLNLGVRWWTFPPAWALPAMAACDVVSFNCYQARPDMVSYGRGTPEPGIENLLAQVNRPCLVGEWHVGSLDGGMTSAGLYAAVDQPERARGYQHYLEQAAALPWCVGAHWFNLYDRNVLYSPASNENYHAGFLDMAHRPHQELAAAARQSHERLYAVAAGLLVPAATPAREQFPSR